MANRRTRASPVTHLEHACGSCPRGSAFNFGNPAEPTRSGSAVRNRLVEVRSRQVASPTPTPNRWEMGLDVAVCPVKNAWAGPKVTAIRAPSARVTLGLVCGPFVTANRAGRSRATVGPLRLSPRIEAVWRPHLVVAYGVTWERGEVPPFCPTPRVEVASVQGGRPSDRADRALRRATAAAACPARSSRSPWKLSAEAPTAPGPGCPAISTTTKGQPATRTVGIWPHSSGLNANSSGQLWRV
jgi:hypothetical protein